jgi:hypothetical protein
MASVWIWQGQDHEESTPHAAHGYTDFASVWVRNFAADDAHCLSIMSSGWFGVLFDGCSLAP